MLNLYTSCYDITLKEYIRIVIHSDFKVLRKYKIPTPLKFYIKAFLLIQDEHSQISQNEEAIAAKRKIKTLDRLNNDRLLLISCYYILLFSDGVNAINRLKELGYNTSNKINLIKELKNVINVIDTKIETLSKKEEKEPKEIKESDFYDMITFINECGHLIDENINYGRYISIINRLNNNKENAKIRNKRLRF